jgi:hypothetical protein
MFACLRFPSGSTNMKHDLQRGTSRAHHLPLGCITWQDGFKIVYPEHEPVTAYI